MAKQLIDLDTIDRSTEEGRAAWFKAHIDNGMIHNAAEARIVNKIVKTLKAAGNPVVSVWDGAESTNVKTLRDVQEQVFNLDQCHLYTKSGGWVFIVLGNDWDALTDYTLSLEDALKPVNDYIDKHN